LKAYKDITIADTNINPMNNHLRTLGEIILKYLIAILLPINANGADDSSKGILT
jgi:hypothetical protein